MYHLFMPRTKRIIGGGVPVYFLSDGQPEKTMRAKLIACDILREEVKTLCAEWGASPADYGTDFLEMRLHDQPELLKKDLARRIAGLRGAPYDVILLGLGLCQNSVVGLEAPGIPLVMPRTHDCIALFMGSTGRYMAEHRREPGTYWFARGFMHRQDREGGETDWQSLGQGSKAGENGDSETGGMRADMSREEQYQKWVEAYGEDNARYLMEEWLDAWKKNYRRAAYLWWEADPDREADRDRIRRHAAENNWSFEQFDVDLGWLRGLLDGGWKRRPSEYLVALPGQTIQAAHDGGVVRAV